MGAIIGVIIGYALGSRAGEEGWAEIEEAWKTITTSEEVRDFIAGGVSIARDLADAGRRSSPGSSGCPSEMAKLGRAA